MVTKILLTPLLNSHCWQIELDDNQDSDLELTRGDISDDGSCNNSDDDSDGNLELSTKEDAELSPF